MARQSGAEPGGAAAGGPGQLTRSWQEARERVAGFLAERSADQRILVFCHNDADGLAAGAILVRGLRTLGFGAAEALPAARGESAFSDGARARLRALRPDALVVADLGVHADGVLPDVPTLFLDHHSPLGVPDHGVIVSGYGWEPTPTSAWLAYECLRPLGALEPLEWIAALGAIGDLGEDAPWPRLARVQERYTKKWLREATVLINAARRTAEPDPETPLRILLQAEHPRELSERRDLGADRLHEFRAEVHRELVRVRRHAPVFSDTRPFALVSLRSRCQVHPLIAQQWRGRLPKFAAIAANTGYLPGVIAFSVRTARRDLALPAILRAVDLDDDDGRYGGGHDQASGGQLAPAAFRRLLAELGFAPAAVEKSFAAATASG